MSMSRDDLRRMQASARVVQERYDSAFEPWGVRARAPTLCEHFDDYRTLSVIVVQTLKGCDRRDLAVKAKKLLPEGHDLRKPQYRAMDAPGWRKPPLPPGFAASNNPCSKAKSAEGILLQCTR